MYNVIIDYIYNPTVRCLLVCPLSATERFPLQPLVCGTVFHRTLLLPPLSIFCSHLKSHLFSLSYATFLTFSLICTVIPSQCVGTDLSFWTL